MPAPLIDAHIHVFNVGFLPVDGIMHAHNVPTFLSKVVTRFLERVLERELPVAGLRDDPPDRQPLIAMLESELRADASLRAALAPDEPDLITRVAQLVPARDLDALRDDLIAAESQISPEARAATKMRTPATAAPEPYDEDRRRLDALLREAARHAGPIESEEHELHGIAGFSIRGLIDWLLLLVQHESRIANAFADAWTPAQTISLGVHHMMDMAPHYQGRAPVYRYVEEQLPRMRAVAAAPPVPLVGFVAYSPLRNDCRQIIQGALADGFAGVKFYPPSGYKPISNAGLEFPNGVTGAKVDERNLQLFTDCGAQVPIFAHCTRGGVEVEKGVTGKYSNPEFWRDVLARPGLGDLRLCLGHAGGEEGWFAELGAGDDVWRRSYASTVVELCVKPGSNVYCDFGFFDGILDGRMAHHFVKRLASVVAQHGAHFAKKCCYGTDWHLVSRKSGAAAYPDRFARLLRDNSDLKQYADDILGRNALRYLNLPAFLERSGAKLGELERQRLEALVDTIA